MAPVALGAVVGIPAALVVSGALRAVLYGIGPRNATVFLGTSLALLAVALIASFVPARRAANLDAVLHRVLGHQE